MRPFQRPIPLRKPLRKPLVPLFGVVAFFMIFLLGCTKPDFRTFNDPVMTTSAMQAELERLHEINLTVGDGGFDTSRYPISVGVDARNGKMLVEKFICWDECPDMGMVFLLYQNVESAEACAAAVVGTPLFSPEPLPGQYWGCRPVVDWLDQPERSPG